jgi:hypothetical protein
MSQLRPLVRYFGRAARDGAADQTPLPAQAPRGPH